jgi:UDP-glucose 4-epimerase
MTDRARRRVLVTGGAGFIGTHVVRALARRGDQVMVADLNPYPDTSVASTAIDLTSPGAAESVVEPGLDAIVHLAAATQVLRSVERPAATFDINVRATERLLEAARSGGVGTFILASTNAVVGLAEDERIDERTALRPLTPYGATKAAAEMLLSAYGAAYGVRGTALRLTNAYGTGMARKDSIVPRLMRAARDGGTFEVYGSGRQLRDYVYVDDVVRAVILALDDEEVSGPLVVGSGSSTSVNQLVAMARAATGTDLPCRHVDQKPGEMAQVVVDIGHARALGWTPTVGLADGLRQVWAEWRDTRRGSPAGVSRPVPA